MPSRLCPIAILLVLAVSSSVGRAEPAGELRLIPQPKRVEVRAGSFALDRPLVLEAPSAQARRLAELLGEELGRFGLGALEASEKNAQPHSFRIAPRAAQATAAPSRAKLEAPTEAATEAAAREAYCLLVAADEILCTASTDAGLLHGLATVRQLVRANRRDRAIPCLSIRDWPSLRWRCFQDDMTRGPSSRLATLEFEAGLGSYLKLNLMTYYMEYQYEFQKHPEIGPKDGSLTAAELKKLVEFAGPLGVDILGNQQSFGHFSQILKHPRYAAMAEAPDVLSPVKEETYQLLDDLYSEVCPVLPFSLFNVCCDETWDLGKGPSKELAAKIGVGGVYVRHIRRVHDLVTRKYGKRMLMWGDIILQHPDQLKEVPKDTIMLTWGYDARPSFEDQIIPFAKSGYEFFVCPGVSNWSRILPDFGVATTNIRNFVRDGVKHGAIGMLNTDWEDDGEALNGVKWHGDAWAAECAWNGATTPPEVFNRRVGAVLFGESGDHFGRAIELLAQTHRLAGMQGMNNRRFWESDFPPKRPAAEVRKSADELLAMVRPAIVHLEACRKEAVVNANVIETILFGARRMERIGQRMLDALEAARLYGEACQKASDAQQRVAEKEKTVALVARAEALVRANRDAHEALGRQFAALWLGESKPYALDWTTRRYEAATKSYDGILTRLADARKAAEAGQPLPSVESVGLAASAGAARPAP